MLTGRLPGVQNGTPAVRLPGVQTELKPRDLKAIAVLITP